MISRFCFHTMNSKKRRQNVPLSLSVWLLLSIAIATVVPRVHGSFPLGVRMDKVDRLESTSTIHSPHQLRTAMTTSRQEQITFGKADPAVLIRRYQQPPPVHLCASKTAISSSTSSATTTATNIVTTRPLVFWENMVCGAISRSIAQTIMHPANTMKTILQSTRGPGRPTIAALAHPRNFHRLSRGAGANFLLSVPHGAVNFAVLEFVRSKLNALVQQTPTLQKRQSQIGPGLDFLSSSISTICCSIVSTPQMMITDNIMAGNFNNMQEAIRGLYLRDGIQGFYAGWWPGLAGKIPSYALTWTLFQRLKAAQRRVCERNPTDLENSIMGCLAATTTVCIMIPMDTIKTRLVTQASMKAMAGVIPYKGIIDCAMRMAKEEGMATFYRGLPPRLVSVVPMIGIQFGVYEFMRQVMVERSITIAAAERAATHSKTDDVYPSSLQQATMEVAASFAQPFPVPRFWTKISALTRNGGAVIRRKLQ